MSSKSYGQYCSIARALDVVGERWSLLVVRELLEGPRRYVDLQAGLVHVSTDMLATRLRDLEDAGLIRRREKVYELTARGRELEPVLDALARFGLAQIGPRRDEAFHPEWLSRAVRAVIRPDRDGVDLVVRFEVPEGPFALHIDGQQVDPVDVATKADVVLTGRVEDLAALAANPTGSEDLIASGRLSIDGSTQAVQRFAGLFAPR